MLNAEKLPTLQAQGLHLRWLEEDDIDDLFAIFSHSAVARYWSSPEMTERSQAVELLDGVRRGFSDGNLYQWGVELDGTKGIIGTCTLAGIDPNNRRAEIGFALHPDFWKRGHMRQAVHAMVRFAFDELKLHRLEADTDPRNEASNKLVENLGFQREGYLRERWIVAGEICDTLLFGLLAKDFQAESNPASQ